MWTKKEVVKSFNAKKEELNKEMYQTDLKFWYNLHSTELTYLLETIETLLEPKVSKKKEILNRKVNAVFNRQNKIENLNRTEHAFFQRVSNLTDIRCSEPEMTLLSKGVINRNIASLAQKYIL